MVDFFWCYPTTFGVLIHLIPKNKLKSSKNMQTLRETRGHLLFANTSTKGKSQATHRGNHTSNIQPWRLQQKSGVHANLTWWVWHGSNIGNHALNIIRICRHLCLIVLLFSTLWDLSQTNANTKHLNTTSEKRIPCNNNQTQSNHLPKSRIQKSNYYIQRFSPKLPQ